MIEIESRELADIPVLHAYPVGQKDTPLPCVIFYHGFTSSSLVYSYFAVALAQAGLLAIHFIVGWRAVIPSAVIAPIDAPPTARRSSSSQFSSAIAARKVVNSCILCSKICQN